MKQKYMIKRFKDNLFFKVETLQVDRMIVKDGCYMFQNNINTNTVEKLEKKYKNPYAVDDLAKPIWETVHFFPINSFIVTKI